MNKIKNFEEFDLNEATKDNFISLAFKDVNNLGKNLGYVKGSLEELIHLLERPTGNITGKRSITELQKCIKKIEDSYKILDIK
jgi:hypothetical protein